MGSDNSKSAFDCCSIREGGDGSISDRKKHFIDLNKTVHDIHIFEEKSKGSNLLIEDEKCTNVAGNVGKCLA